MYDTEAEIQAAMADAISVEALEFVSSCVEYRVQREYGDDVQDALAGARMIAVAQLAFDLADAGVVPTGPEAESLAATQYNIMVAEGLEIRACQCGASGRSSHGMLCTGHYQTDVPVVEGKRLCGACYVSECNTSPV